MVKKMKINIFRIFCFVFKYFKILVELDLLCSFLSFYKVWNRFEDLYGYRVFFFFGILMCLF